jgi:hypothetical protein
MTDISRPGIHYDEADCQQGGCLHNTPPARRDVLYIKEFEVASGYMPMDFAGGPEADPEVGLVAMQGTVSQTTLRLTCIEPQTGTEVQMSFVTSPMLAHHLGVELVGSIWHHSASADQIWTPETQDDADPDGVKVGAIFYVAETLCDDGPDIFEDPEDNP